MVKDEALNLIDVVYIIKKRMVIILTIMLITGLVSALYSFKLSKPIYEANTSMIFGNTDSKLSMQEMSNNLMLNQNLLSTYAEIAKSKNVAEIASKKLNGEISAEEIYNSIDVTIKDKTQLLEISSKSENSEKSVRILNAVSEAFIEQSKEMYPLAYAHVLDEAQFSKVISTNKVLFIGVSLFIGILISIGIIFIVEYCNSLKREYKH